MYNLQKKLRSLTPVENWYDESIVGGTNYLAKVFDDAFDNDNIFSAIWVAIRENPKTAQEEENPTYTYSNIGFTPAQIADYFNTRYSCNYFLYNFKVQSEYDKLLTRIKSIYKANFYKYKKLIEVMGYKYNPLYNVDGTELYANMESIGDTESERTPSGRIRTTSGTLNGTSIGSSTTENYTNPYDSNSGTDPSYLTDKTVTNAITTDQEYLDNYNEKTAIANQPAQKFSIDPQTGQITKSGLYDMAAKDSAFSVALNGAERYYAEKRIRQGNIGVTKTTELIEAQREAVRFNLLDEFFRDLEHDIIVGIY